LRPSKPWRRIFTPKPRIAATRRMALARDIKVTVRTKKGTEGSPAMKSGARPWHSRI
jgi:hypothetical protein